jgi:malate synthase-like protein
VAEGFQINKAYVLKALEEETAALTASAPAGNKFDLTAKVLAEQVTGEKYADFLTT